MLALVLERILEQVGGEHATAARNWTTAAWVGWRLVECCRCPIEQRQALLQEDDPHARLDRLLVLVS